MKSNNPIFILEGPDCTGKSTLGQMLASIHGAPIYHCTYIKDKEAMYSQFKTLLDLIHDGSRPLVIDRYVYSNVVYGDIYQNGEYVKDYKELLDPTIIGQDNVKVIFTLPEIKQQYLDFYASKYSEREEMYSLESAGTVWDGFNDLLSNPHNKHRELLKNVNWKRYDMFSRTNERNFHDEKWED